MLNHDLEQIAVFARSVSSDKLDRVLVLERPPKAQDVVSDVVAAINHMIAGLRDDWQKLEEKLHLRNCDLEEALAQAGAATQAKANFLAAMSHEIRTPLNGILGMADLLAGTKLDGDQTSMLQAIRISGKSLLRTVNDVLTFSEMQASKFDIEKIPFSITNIVEDAATTLASSARARSVRLLTCIDQNIPQSVLGDPIRIRQILGNIIDNAIKFSPEQEVVVVRADLVGDYIGSGLLVRFSISDRGAGMSAAIQGSLFQPFTQGDLSTTREHGGIGLGLSICQRLVDAMGGDISVNSKPEQGATFQITLLLPACADEADPEPEFDLSGLRTLFVHTHEAAREAGHTYLKYFNANVTVRPTYDDCSADCTISQDSAWDVIVLADYAQDDVAGTDLRRIVAANPSARLIIGQDAGAAAMRLPASPHISTVYVDPLCRSVLGHAVANVVGRVKPNTRLRFSAPTIPGTGAVPDVDQAIAQGRLILVVEDNVINQNVIKRQLMRLGYACEIANDGKEGFSMWQSQSYAVVLTDCHMPNMDGFEFTAAIRRQEVAGGSRVPIVAITANTMQGEQERCLAGGMDDYLSKPLDMQKLEQMLNKWMPGANALEPFIKHSASPEDLRSPVDLSFLAECFGDDRDLHREVLDGFAQSAHEYSINIRKAVLAGESAEASSLAHALKSASLTVGANQVADVCQRIEDAGKVEGMDLEAFVLQLESSLARVLEYIRDF